MLSVLLSLAALIPATQDPITVGFNYPETGPYAVQGLDQWRAAQIAVEEINTAGGVLGRPIQLAVRDTQSNADLAAKNAEELISQEGAAMVFGGSSSGVAIATGKVCDSHQVPFFGTLTYSTATTGKEARKYVFRETYDSWAAANVLAGYMEQNFKGKRYLYITADYTWGHTTEQSFRELTGTTDDSKHKRMMTPFPGATDADFKKAISFAKLVKPDVLVLVLFGKDMERGIRQATAMGLKSKMQIVVPNLTLGMADGGGAKVMEGVVGAVPWCWQVPYQFGHDNGKAFVDEFVTRYERYPSSSGGSAYTILHQWKAAAERAGSIAGPDIVSALEGHSYSVLKDEQQWRAFDHQSMQTVFAVRCKSADQVKADRFGLDYFEIIHSLSGQDAFVNFDQWSAARKAAGKATEL